MPTGKRVGGAVGSETQPCPWGQPPSSPVLGEMMWSCLFLKNQIIKVTFTFKSRVSSLRQPPGSLSPGSLGHRHAHSCTRCLQLLVQSMTDPTAHKTQKVYHQALSQGSLLTRLGELF